MDQLKETNELDIIGAMRMVYPTLDDAAALPLEALNSDIRFLQIVKSLGNNFIHELKIHIYRKWKIKGTEVNKILEPVVPEPSELSESFMFEMMNKNIDILKSIENFCKEQPVYFDDARNWWLWNHHKFMWIRVDETDMLNALDDAIKYPSANAQIKHEVLEALRRTGRRNRPKDAEDTWIQFRDQVYDLKTGEHFTSSPEFFVTNPIDIDIGTSNKTPIMDELFTQWVGADHIQELYEIIAFALFKKYIIHRIICFIGSGANGKSTFINMMKKFIGKENICSSSLDLLATNRFESSKLYKKLLCLMGETNFSTIKRTELIKSLSGEDSVRAEFKGKDCFDFENTAKLIIATNSLPNTLDKTDGYYRRWKIIDFPNKFTKEKDILCKIPYEEYQNLARKSLQLASKLWSSREFTNDGDFEKRRRDYEEKSNPLMLFIKNNYTKNLHQDTLFSDFYNSFIDFLSSNGYRMLTNTAVSKALKNDGFEIKAKSMRKDGKKTTAKCILGLSSNESLSVLPDLSMFQLSTTRIELSKNMSKTDKTDKTLTTEDLKIEDSEITPKQEQSENQELDIEYINMSNYYGKKKLINSK